MLHFDQPALIYRRQRLAAALSPALGEAVLLVYAGEPLPLPENTDQTYPFRAHSEYFYLTHAENRGGVVVFDPQAPPDAAWRSFVADLTEGERIWEGRAQAPGESLPLLADWLAQRAARPVIRLGAAAAPAPEAIAQTDAVREAFKHARRPKDSTELEKLRRAAACTAAGFDAIRSLIRPGKTERQLQIELEAAFFRAGAHRTGYGTLVGSGPQSAILHCDPSERVLKSGEFVLIDAGAEVERYVCDVTRTYVVGGNPTPFQRDLHQLVRSVEEAAIARCRPGAEWKELHLQAATELTAGLVYMELLRGEPASLVEQEAHSLFFPHGLGHLVGLGVRDASGLLPGRAKDPRASLKSLRTDLPLAPGYVITVEPGLYFIDAILNDPARRERYRDVVKWSAVDALLQVGGVRIEDNVLITDGAPEILTAAIPKTMVP